MGAELERARILLEDQEVSFWKIIQWGDHADPPHSLVRFLVW
jgi:hypothetical protein